MRKYIRHPTSIPIQVTAENHHAVDVRASNLSHDGLCFITDAAVKVGDLVDVGIPSLMPACQCEGVIMWRRGKNKNMFEVGVRFVNEDEYFRVRMVEQVCQIEAYRQKLAQKGRNLSSEEAAQEWITQFAADFDKGKNDS